MKKDYLHAEVDVIRFANADLIVTSTPIGEGDEEVRDSVGNKDFS